MRALLGTAGVKVVSMERFEAFPIHAPFVTANLYKLN